MNKNKENWISLKEASKISGYSSDYIGQLIRKGKIPGKQVYYNVAWTTKAEALLEYKQKEKKRGRAKKSLKEKTLDFFRELRQKIVWEAGVLKLFFKTFKYVLPIIIILILSFSMLLFYLFFIFSNGQEEIILDKDIEEKDIMLKY